MQTSRFFIGVLGIILLSACASNVVVDSDIPKPLMQRLPVTAKLHLSEAFSSYTYIEQDKGRSIDSLEFGAAQEAMFKQVFGSAFTLLNDTSGANAMSADVHVRPTVLSVQYSTPRETALNIYEVSLKYRITLTRSANDEKLADWVIKGYGKTPTAFLKSAEAAFNAATNVALRDVGAQISIGLPLQSSIQALVKRKSVSQSAKLPNASSEQTVAPRPLGDTSSAAAALRTSSERLPNTQEEQE